MRVTVNGESLELSESTTLLDYLIRRNLNPAVLVVEYNGKILHRDHWSQIQIGDGDTLEILSFVGGG
ncbi:sulfur carrier protein ThiS [Heliobacterium chlorum]|uniref:Sulfur carrier protein ThiS n=1 Tax=Heliobacterium chlorum TaxID=2698 RepID=A0ABR7SXD9_HELCL|nr:sulfur carrier protein ThiS [Heliobacterium chlorum]MBC9783224.1 sulfur carrier protein ThiS [Heliobacterium chlorum]